MSSEWLASVLLLRLFDIELRDYVQEQLSPAICSVELLLLKKVIAAGFKMVQALACPVLDSICEA